MSPARRSPKVTQHATATGLARIIQATGDLIVYGGEEPYRWGNWPAPGLSLLPSQARAKPSELLRAANAFIDFVDRPDTLAELRQWRDQTVASGMGVRLLHGPGGQGKTRLAGHLAGLWQQDGWVVLAAHRRDDRSTPDNFEVPDFDGAAGVLVVVDYAERWDTADLLTLLSDTHLPGRLPVRVLLLARPTGTWWEGLDYRLQHDLRLTPTRRELKPLEQETELSRAGLFCAARDRFADLLGLPAATSVPTPRALDEHEAYELVLSIHMAALAGVLAYESGSDPPGDPVQVSTFLLRRERALWREMSQARHEARLSTSPDAMGQLVYTATVTGRLDYDDALAAVERADIESREHPGQLLKDHALCYPPAGPAPWRDRTVGDQDPVTRLEPLYPDRLGEDFLALSTPGHSCDFTADPWATRAPARLLAPSPDSADRAGEGNDVPVWARHGLITLIEAARRWPHLANKQLYPLLAAHPHLALHAGGASLAGLASLDDIDPALLETIESALPAHRDFDLDIGIAAVASRLAEHRLATTTDPATQAKINDALALCLSNAGLHSRALAVGHQAAQIWYQLAERDRDAYLPSMAASLMQHANRLAAVGRRNEAVPISEQALDCYWDLEERRRGSYLPGLAGSLMNHAVLLVEVGRRDEAIPISNMAVTFLPRPFQDHDVRPRMANGLSMDRLAQRVASVTSARPERRRAQIARLRRAAMTLGPDRVLTCDLSSWYRVSRSQ